MLRFIKTESRDKFSCTESNVDLFKRESRDKFSCTESNVDLFKLNHVISFPVQKVM